MEHHEINLDAFQQWRQEAEILFASSTRERKRLFANLIGGLRIEVDGVTVWQGIQPFAAVEKYNSITEKF